MMTDDDPRCLTDRQAERLQAGIRALVRRFGVAERADFSCCGMTVAQAATLQALCENELRLSQLSARLGIAPSTLTRNLARLEERGLVRRTDDPTDRRAQRVALTAAGRRAAATAADQEQAFAQSILDHLPTGSIDVTLDAFNELLLAVRRATEDCCPGAFDHLMTGLPCCDTRRTHE